ncbi:sigma-70 family RNA polymerase sigma factor [Myxococcaceae bacterium GXIMD 01537]
MREPPPLTSLFIPHLGPEARARVDAGALEPLLAGALAEARAAWPGLPLPEATYLRHLAERLPSQVPPTEALAGTHVADLYLACACAHGLPAAHAALEAHVLSKVGAAVARVERSAEGQAEVRQRLRQTLLTPEAGRAPKVASYQGQGPLEAWVRVAAVRLALNLRRAEERRERAEEAALSEGAVPAGDLEADYLRRQHRADFQEALSEALAALPVRDRTVLRLHVVEGLSLERIGVLYQTHKSTVSRQLARAREEVMARARERLAERLRLSPTELHSLLRAVRDELDLSLPSLPPEPG